MSAAVTTAAPRRFVLDRRRDISGVSGVGTIAHGVVFEDGQAVVRWLSDHPCVAVWPSIDDAIAVHGHGGATVVRWLDPADDAVPPAAGEPVRELLAELAGAEQAVEDRPAWVRMLPAYAIPALLFVSVVVLAGVSWIGQP